MKTTLNIDDDVLAMARIISDGSGLSIGKVISGLVRTQLPRKRNAGSKTKRVRIK